jgi:hypothetical protein
MGSWAESTDENGKGIVFSSLGPTGAITWFDSNKKYFAAILSSELQNSQRFQLINQIRRSIEESVE